MFNFRYISDKKSSPNGKLNFSLILLNKFAKDKKNWDNNDSFLKAGVYFLNSAQ